MEFAVDELRAPGRDRRAGHRVLCGVLSAAAGGWFAVRRCVLVVAVLAVVAAVLSLEVWQPEGAAAHPEPPRVCDQGYTLSGDTCERTVTSSLLADGSCEAGFTAVYSEAVICVRTTTTDATASCGAGYTLSGDTCERTVTSSLLADGSCEAGFTAVYSEAVICVRTTTTDATASCGAGYTLSGDTCERTVTSLLLADGSCEAG